MSLQITLSNEQMHELAVLIASEINTKKEPIYDIWFSVFEVAKKLNVQPATIRVYIRKGLLKATQSGKKYQISQVDLEKYIKRNE